MPSVEDIRRVAQDLGAQYGVDRMYLFGSYARGDNDEASDIDLRIDKGRVRGLQMAYLLSDLEDALHCPVDLLSTATLDPSFLYSIAGEEKLLYDRTGS